MNKKTYLITGLVGLVIFIGAGCNFQSVFTDTSATNSTATADTNKTNTDAAPQETPEHSSQEQFLFIKNNTDIKEAERTVDMYTYEVASNQISLKHKQPHTKGAIYETSISPDGSQVVMAYDTTILIAETAKLDEWKEVTTTDHPLFGVAWANDSRTLFYYTMEDLSSSNEALGNKKDAIYKIDSDGKNEKLLFTQESSASGISLLGGNVEHGYVVYTESGEGGWTTSPSKVSFTTKESTELTAIPGSEEGGGTRTKKVMNPQFTDIYFTAGNTIKKLDIATEEVRDVYTFEEGVEYKMLTPVNDDELPVAYVEDEKNVFGTLVTSKQEIQNTVEPEVDMTDANGNWTDLRLSRSGDFLFSGTCFNCSDEEFGIYDIQKRTMTPVNYVEAGLFSIVGNSTVGWFVQKN